VSNGQAHEPGSPDAQAQSKEGAHSQTSRKGEGQAATQRSFRDAAMSEPISTDSIIDTIALLELQSQEMHREPDPEGWRSRTLATLRDLLRQLDEAAQLHGPGADHSANVEAVNNAIRRIESRGRPASKSSTPKKSQPEGRHNRPRREGRGRPPDQGKQGKGGRHRR